MVIIIPIFTISTLLRSEI